MAMADYRQCDVCGCKAFYDANLNYEWPDRNGNGSWGQKIEPHEIVRDSGHKLDSLGDWAVICTDCAKTHKCVVIPMDQTHDEEIEELKRQKDVLLEELENIATAEWREFDHETRRCAYDFVLWAQSRARHTINMVLSGDVTAHEEDYAQTKLDEMVLREK